MSSIGTIDSLLTYKDRLKQSQECLYMIFPISWQNILRQWQVCGTRLNRPDRLTKNAVTDTMTIIGKPGLTGRRAITLVVLRACGATLKVGGGGGGGWLDSKWVGWKHLFLSSSLKFEKMCVWGGEVKPPPCPSPSACPVLKSLRREINHTPKKLFITTCLKGNALVLLENRL